MANNDSKRRKRQAKPPVTPRPNVGFDDVVERMAQRGRTGGREFLTEVHTYASEMHGEQTRRSGEPYISHPTYVAYILADLKFDEHCVAAAFLHDVLEDTGATREELERRFGEDVTELVDGVSKISRQEYIRRDEAQAETFRKMILASARDLRVILVKLADRLHNMMTLEHMTVEARRRISAETLEIYAPIAHRLGMSKVQGDLEDLAFFYRYPLQFAEIEAKIRQKMKTAHGSLQRLRSQLTKSLEEAGIEAEISYRLKRYYSIYRKLRRQGIDISQLYDFLAFRIITENLKDSYAAFGVVHQNWRPIPGRFKDYIAMPKPNLYQSLHTTVVGEKGQPFEVQIRTRDMDLIAEEGIAAHWHYKTGRQSDPSDPNILWLRQLLEWQKEVQDPREFLSALKIDLYPDEVYVFTPRGDVRAFPRGATPLDFAYRVHTDLGHQCSGARVNGRLVPLRTPLQNGDIVEILTASGRTPSRDWLNYVVTSRARSKIRHWLNTQQKLESQEIGRKILERHLKKLGVSVRKTLESPRLAEYMKSEGLPKIEDLYQKLGYGKTPIKHVLSRILDAGELEGQSEPTAWRRAVDRIMPFGRGPVTVRGEGDLMATLAKCCSPVPGEDLIGYVTRGRGISVHSVDCPNVKNLLFDPGRVIEVEWERRSEGVYPVSLAIRTEERQGMIAQLTEVIAREASNIRQFEAAAIDNEGLIDVVVEVRNRKHLERLRRALGDVAGVLQVTRRMSGQTARGEELH